MEHDWSACVEAHSLDQGDMNLGRLRVAEDLKDEGHYIPSPHLPQHIPSARSLSTRTRP